MKIYDISQEVLSSNIYPGDPKPQLIEERRIKKGSLYNLTSLSMCTHNGTHIDAPFHFIDDGMTIEQIPLEKLIGDAYVVEINGILTKELAIQLLDQIPYTKIILKNTTGINSEAAQILSTAQLDLIGCEQQSISTSQETIEVHKILLSSNIIILEGLVLNHINEGKYILNAAPLALKGSDGSPVRAVLIKI